MARSFFRKDTTLQGQLIVTSDFIDCNQLMRAMEMGTSYRAKVEAGYRDTIGGNGEIDDMEALPVVSDSISLAGNNSLFVVPPGIDFTFQTDIRKVMFGQLEMDSIHGEVVITLASTPMPMPRIIPAMPGSVSVEPGKTVK